MTKYSRSVRWKRVTGSTDSSDSTLVTCPAMSPQWARTGRLRGPVGKPAASKAGVRPSGVVGPAHWLHPAGRFPLAGMFGPQRLQLKVLAGGEQGHSSRTKAVGRWLPLAHLQPALGRISILQVVTPL